MAVTPSDQGVPLAFETARATKVEVETGRVRLSTYTDTVEDLVRDVLESRSVEVTRVPVDRVVDKVPPIRTEGDITVISIVEEVFLVEKRLVLKEELHLRTITATEAVAVPVTLKKQRAVIERLDPSETSEASED